ncbi:MAG: AAA family ATPase [Lachnospiraceae bacterium]|nr:AAA family ATPase [Lachnospiraceae bacterium]
MLIEDERELHIRGVHIDWDKIDRRSYLWNIPAIAGVNDLTFHKPITFFVGENGSGKSTLLEAIAVAYGFNPEGGTKNYSFSTYDSHSQLHDAMRIIKGRFKPGWGYFLRAESFYNVATAEEEYNREYGKSLYFHEKSHGESFLAMAQNNFKQNGIYLLDEPEAALSPQRQLTLLLEIMECANKESQFIIVSHSPILLGMPNAEILSFDEGEIHACGYTDTDSYKVTEMFINNRELILKRLLEG